MGRFVAQDPLGLAAGQNLYAYVGNNPIGLTDPLGEDWKSNVLIGLCLLNLCQNPPWLPSDPPQNNSSPLTPPSLPGSKPPGPSQGFAPKPPTAAEKCPAPKPQPNPAGEGPQLEPAPTPKPAPTPPVEPVPPGVAPPWAPWLLAIPLMLYSPDAR
jgi:hypothetical protein